MTLACTGIGIGVAHGVAIGRAHLLHPALLAVIPRWIAATEVEAEIDRFRTAVEAARSELRAVRKQIPPETASDISGFIDTHLLMLQDGAIAEAPVELIREQHCCAEWALEVRRTDLVRLFDEMDDPYLRTRKDDVNHVVTQILKRLTGDDGIGAVDEVDLRGCIILAQDLTPADAILMRNRGIAGFVTEYGGPMSHTAILARSLEIPAVVGVRHATRCLHQGETLVIDGEQGVVLADLSAELLDHYRARIRDQRARVAELRRIVDLPAVSRDGVPVTLMANIELPEDIDATLRNGAVGIGLYRTEFLYMNRNDLPDEEEHYATYLEVVRGLQGIPLTIRTLDLGADKQVHNHASLQPIPASNPALGLRAIRLCLKEPELFRPQVRAILRASAHGPVRMVLPMLSSLKELMEVKALIERARLELVREEVAFDPALPIGGMIEVPAAALSATAFARELDFLSIGTNDLIQYTLAIDRVDDEVNYLFDPLHPAVLRLVKMTIDAAGARRIPVSMCGEMAADPRSVRLLLGLGLREFSMHPASLLEVRRVIRATDIGALGPRTERLLAEMDERDVNGLLDELNAD